MTNRNAGTVAIKLDLRGQEELKRRLDELGPAGERLGKDLERAMKPAQQGMGAFGRATDEVKSGLDGLAQRAGPVGSFLTSIGPWGLAGAAGLGVLVAAAREFFVLMDRANDTAMFADGLETVERTSGIAADRVLDLGTALRLAGGDFQSALNGAEEFSKRLGEYRATGQGEGRDALQALGLDALALSEAPIEEVLDRVLERLAEIEDPSRRLAIADKLGLRDAAPLLQQSADEMQRILETAGGINAAFSGDVLERFASAAQAIREAEARQERARQMQSLAGLDAEVARQEAIARFEEFKATTLASRIPLEERSVGMLEAGLAVARQTLEVYERQVGQVGLDASQRAIIRSTIREQLRIEEDITAEMERRAAIVRASQVDLDDFFSSRYDNGDTLPVEPPAPRTPELDLERRRELEGLIEAQLRALQTPLQRVAALEADLNEARDAGLEISQRQITAILEHQRAALGLSGKLADLTDEERKLMGAVQATEDPLERQKELLESLTAPVEALETRLLDLYAVLAQSPEHADLLMAEIARVKDSLYGDDDEQPDGGDRNELFPNLSKIAEEAANTREQLDRLASDGVGILGDELRDLRRGTDSAADAFEDMVRRMIDAWAEMQIQQHLLGPLAGFLESGLSAAFGGGGVKAGVKHAGGAIGEPGGPSRTVPMSAFSGAMRAHTGGFFGDDEFPLIGKRGERMLNPSENSALLALLDRAAGSMGGDVQVRFHGAPAGTRVKETRGPNGLQLDVLFEMVDERAAQTSAATTGEMMRNGSETAAAALAEFQAMKG